MYVSDPNLHFNLQTYISISDLGTLIALTMSFYFLYSDALTPGAFLSVEGLSLPVLANSGDNIKTHPWASLSNANQQTQNPTNSFLGILDPWPSFPCPNHPWASYRKSRDKPCTPVSAEVIWTSKSEACVALLGAPCLLSQGFVSMTTPPFVTVICVCVA